MSIFSNNTINNNNSSKKTFILIVIVVLAGIGFAIKTTYDSFISRSKISEAFLLVEPIQNVLSEFATKNGSYPLDQELNNTSFGLPQPFEIQGTYINSVVTHKEKDSNNVTIFAYINTQIIPDLEDGNSVIINAPYIKFVGKFDGNRTDWSCTSNLAQHYLPNTCKGS